MLGGPERVGAGAVGPGGHGVDGGGREGPGGSQATQLSHADL